MRTGTDTGYETVTYVTGHVPGGDHGTTSSHNIDCTVPTTPPVTPNLPNTGASSWTIFAVGVACILAGAALVSATRRTADPQP